MPRRGRNHSRPKNPLSMFEFHDQLSRRFNHMTLCDGVSLYSGLVIDSPSEGITLLFTLPFVNEILKTGTVFAINGSTNFAPHFLNNNENNQQIYVIMGLNEEKGFPIAFALMSKRTEIAYTALLKKIMSIEPQWKPEAIIINYERALIASIKSVFPSTKIQGCWVYFCLQLFDKLSELNLNHTRKTNRFIYDCFHMALSLPLLPRDHTLKGFIELQKKFDRESRYANLRLDVRKRFKSFIQWIESTWLKGDIVGILPMDEENLLPIVEYHECYLTIRVNMENKVNQHPWPFMRDLLDLSNKIMHDYQTLCADNFEVSDRILKKWIPNKLTLQSLINSFFRKRCSVLEFLTAAMVITPCFEFPLREEDIDYEIIRLIPRNILELVQNYSSDQFILNIIDDDDSDDESDTDSSDSEEYEEPDPPPQLIHFQRQEMNFEPLIEGTCCICLTEYPVAIASPCLHQCLCNECYVKYMETPPQRHRPFYRCALCRSQVDFYIIEQ